MTLYWLNTKTACGGVYVKDGLIVKACPYYRKSLVGKPLADVLRLPWVLDCKRVGI